MARFATFSLGLFVVLLFGAYVLAYFFSDNLLGYFRGQIERQLNTKVTFQRSKLSGRTMTVTGLSLETRGGVPLGRLDEVQAVISPYYFIRYGAQRAFSDFYIKGARLDLHFAPDGRMNWDSVSFPKRDEDRPEKISYRGNIYLQDGFLSLRDQRYGDYLANLDRIEGVFGWEASGDWQVQGQAEQGAIGLRGFGQPGKPVQIDATIKNLDLDNFLLHPNLANQLRVTGSQANGTVQMRIPTDNPQSTLLLGTLIVRAQEAYSPQFQQSVQGFESTLKLMGSWIKFEKTQFSWQQQKINMTGELRNGLNLALGPWIKFDLKSGPISLAKIRMKFPNMPAVQGRASLDISAEGHARGPAVQGQIKAWDLVVSEQKLRSLVADFELDNNSLHLQRVTVITPEGNKMEGHGWIFRDKDQRILLRLSGVPPALESLSPWLAGSDSFQATALGSLSDPVVTGQASLSSMPANALGMTGGSSHFWLDDQSALLWGGRLWGQGGEVQVPWAMVDYRQGDVAGEVYSQNFALQHPQGNATVQGGAQLSGNYLTGLYAATGYLQNGSVQAPGLPPLENLRGVVAYRDGNILIPQMEGTSGGDRATVTGELRDGNGEMWVHAPQVNAQNWVASAPPGLRDVRAFASIQGNSVDRFRLATQGPGGDAWAVGRILDGRTPEFYAQFVDAQVPGQPLNLTGDLATNWQQGKLKYFYSARPTEAVSENWMMGHGSIQGSQLTMVENYLHLPSRGPLVASLGGESQAYPYFGPIESRPIVRLYNSPEAWQTGGTFSWTGNFNLAQSKMDLKLRARNLNLTELNTWFGQLQSPAWWQAYGLTLEDLLLDVDGTAQGTLSNPQVQGSVRSPWTRLSRNLDNRPESLALSWRSDVNYRKGQLDLLTLLSPRPLDSDLLTWKGPSQSPPQADWLRSNLRLTSGLNWKGWIRAEAFPMETAGWLTPNWLSQQLPSGVLSTDAQGLQVSGSLYAPQIAGRVDLRQGQFWTGYRNLPIDEAFADFASNQRATSLTRLRLKSGGLTLEGRGNRTRDGSLTAQFWADDLPLDTLQDFGFSTLGWAGTVDLAMSFRDSGGVSPEGWVALQAEELKAPEGSPFAVERLVFGQIDRQLDGIPFTGPGKGVGFRLEAGEFVVELPPDVAEIVFADANESRLSGSGTFSWKAPPGPRQSLTNWAKSPIGPRFGRNGTPLRLIAERFSWPLLREILGLPTDERVGQISGSLQLLGQFDEQHRVTNPKISNIPFFELDLANFILEGPGAVWSGVRLSQPLKLAYKVVPGAGWLSLNPSVLEFFRKPDANGPATAQGKLQAQASLVLMENPGLKKSASLSPDQSMQASLENLPLENLSFLNPKVSQLSGTIRDFRLDHQGPLSQPQSTFSLDSQNLLIQGLNITAVQGKGTLTSQENGKMQLQLGSGIDELRFLLGALNDPNQAFRVQGQALLDFDRIILMKSPNLVPTWTGWSLSDRSEFDLRAQLNDNQMRLLTALAPEGSKLTGNLEGLLALKGTASKPELTGFLGLNSGSLTHPALRTPLSGVNARLNFEQIDMAEAEPSVVLSRLSDRKLGRYTLEKLEGSLGGQPFSGLGKAEMSGLQPTFVDVTFDGDELPISWDGLMDGRANVHLRMSGVPERTIMGNSEKLIPRLEGLVELPEANFQLPSEATLARFKSLSEGGSSSGIGMLYDVDLRIGEDVWANFLSSTVRATGDLKITPSSKGNTPAVNGQLFLSRGVIRIPFYEVNFRIRQGYAIFEDGFIPRIENLEADSTFGQYQVTARIDGTYPDLKIQLVSNPPMADNELRNMVVTGGLPSATNTNTLVGNSNQSGNFIVNQGVSFISNMLAGAVTQGLGRMLFMSEVSFDVLPTSEYVIRLAKSLDSRDRFLITFAQVIGTNRFNQTLTQYGLEWRFQPNLLTRVSLDNNGQARLWFQGVLRY